MNEILNDIARSADYLDSCGFDTSEWLYALRDIAKEMDKAVQLEVKHDQQQEAR